MRTTKSLKQRGARIVTREEESQIVALLRSTEANHTRNYYRDVADLVEVMVDTGLRQMEVLELMYQDINFIANVILVRQTKSNPRRVPMTSRVSTILMRRQELNKDKPFNLNEMQIRIAWRWVKTEINISDPERLVLHSLRKTCAQRLVDAGVSIEVVCEWLGRHEIRNLHRKGPMPLHQLTEAATMLERYNRSHQQLAPSRSIPTY